MTLVPGDKVVSIQTASGPVLVQVGTMTAGDKGVAIQTATGLVLIPIPPLAAGNKILSLQTATGRVLIPVTARPGGWIQQNAAPGWDPRYFAGWAVTQGDTIIMTGGWGIYGSYVFYNDTWVSSDKGVTWTRKSSTAAWSARCYHQVVTLSDGSFVLMGGWWHNTGPGEVRYNDVWRSADGGVTWQQQTASAEWSARASFRAEVMSDDSIVIMGGNGNVGTAYKNDVWRSTDAGATWTQMTITASWLARYQHTSVVTPDNEILVMGGQTLYGVISDVWASTDYGATWKQRTVSPGWGARYLFGAAVAPDRSIWVLGGLLNGIGDKNDVWRSTDSGETWTQLADADWSGRNGFGCLSLSDRSVMVLGGSQPTDNEIWRYW